MSLTPPLYVYLFFNALKGRLPANANGGDSDISSGQFEMQIVVRISVALKIANYLKGKCRYQ
jgi:hypothetical protein